MKNFCYEICLGLKRKNLQTRDLILNDVENELAKIFSLEKIGFSLTPITGGYISKDKTYIIEDSLRITLIGAFNKEKVFDFANYLKSKFNQEEVLVLIKSVESEYK